MRTTLTAALIIAITLSNASLNAQTYKFDFTSNKKIKDGYVQVLPSDRYDDNKGYGYELMPSPEKNSTSPYFFSVSVPDGNYHVTAVVGSKKSKGITTLRGECRRLFFENIGTKKGETKALTFTINKRNTKISENEFVRTNPREDIKLTWDDKLTFELNGDAPQLSELTIEKVDDVTTVYLCGNSTVVDQDEEPWTSWGQIIPRFFTDKVSFANHGESGERAESFINTLRLKKVLSQIKAGDYVIIEFGHNDQKEKGPGRGAYYSFMTNLKIFIDEARSKGAIPVLVTPTQRRTFGVDGKIKDSHEDYPEAIRWLANKENVPLIDLNDLTRTLYEALGTENSKKAFVHYPAGTYPGQDKALEDNTHFNPYGAYQIAKCVIEGMKLIDLPIIEFLREDYATYSPSNPDPFEDFKWNESPFADIQKPKGN